jgi:hypothetical protein
MMVALEIIQRSEDFHSKSDLPQVKAEERTDIRRKI